MAKVPLRLYIREIENLIDRGQTEESLAHCKYILESYPKCIDVYRLLGKAYLETQRYGEAADILMRVLSSVPDDFVSHVGMSIIREDEGDLNAAVWHMERAYEAQPSNGAVQEELRRLYGRRDGAEPPKIRMTRGALVRMYARGHLYEQAIAEVQAALNEDPLRSDLQVLLAKLYAQTGAKVEATELCSDLLSKFPYCFEANRILSEILPAASRAEDIATYKQRVIDLDPYMEFSTADRPVAEVADVEVAMERLEWEASSSEAAQPSWASSIGISVEPESTDDHVLPDWLASLSSVAPLGSAPAPKPEPPMASAPPPIVPEKPKPAENPAPARKEPPATPPAPASSTDPSLDLPDWMKVAGWSSSTGQAHEEPFVFEDSQNSGEAVMNTDLPEWLRTMAPSPENEVSEGDEAEAAEQFAWLDDISKARSSAADASLGSAGILFPGEPVPTPAEPIFQEPVHSEDPVPAWLNEVSEEPVNSADILPEIPEWQEIPEPEQASPAASEQIPQELNREDTMAWLEDLAEQHNAEAPTMVIRPSDRVTLPPSWIDEKDETNAAAFEPEAEMPADYSAAVDMPQPVFTTEEDNQFASLLSSRDKATSDVDAEPASFQPLAQLDLEAGSEALAAEEFPTWLVELAQPASEPFPAAAPVAALPPTEFLDQSTPAPFEDTTQDEEKAAMAWLDYHSATSSTERRDEDQTYSGLRAEVASAWSADSSSDSLDFSFMRNRFQEVAESEPEPAQDEPEPAANPSLDLPDWLKMIDQSGGQTDAAAGVPGQLDLSRSESDLDRWLKENAGPMESPIAQPSPATETAAVPPQAEAAPVPEAELEVEMPSWLEDLDHSVNNQEEPVEATAEAAAVPSAPVAETAPATESEEIPEWLKDFEPALSTAAQEEVPDVAEVEPSVQAPPPGVGSEEDVEAAMEALMASVAGMDFQPSAGRAVAAPVEPTAEQVQVEKQVEPTPPAPMAETPAVFAEPLEPIAASQPGAENLAETQAAPVMEAEPPLTPEDTQPVRITETGPAEPAPEPVKSAPETAPAAPAAVETPTIEEAQQAFIDGELDTAITSYEQIIRSGENLEKTIHNLQEALYKYPVDISIWQLLGDAYMRSDNLQEAIDAYTKAEELIR